MEGQVLLVQLLALRLIYNTLGVLQSGARVGGILEIKGDQHPPIFGRLLFSKKRGIERVAS